MAIPFQLQTQEGIAADPARLDTQRSSSEIERADWLPVGNSALQGGSSNCRGGATVGLASGHSLDRRRSTWVRRGLSPLAKYGLQTTGGERSE
jgi:hypothetical protein